MPASLDSHSTGLGERPKEKIRLKGVEETLFCTLLPKARDAESPNPVLGDPYASRLIESCDVDLSRSTFQAVDNTRAIRWVVNRSMTFDRWCRDFLQKHKTEPVTVLYLGCGLDCRVHRVMKHARDDVRWIDLDRPLVVDLRRRLIPQSPPGDYHMRTLDVTTTGWLHDIPSDRPTLIMAEGLFMYLTPERVETIIRELVEYFGAFGGEIFLDTVSRLYVKYTDHVELLKASGAKWRWGTDDAREVERFHPRLRLLEHVRSADYMGKKPFGQSQVPLFGEDAAGVLKMVLASMSSSNSAFGQNARFEFSKQEEGESKQSTGAS